MFQPWSLFQLSPALTHELPGVSADEDTWLALLATLQEALDTFNETHSDLTWGDCIHAMLCLAHGLAEDYQADMAEESVD